MILVSKLMTAGELNALCKSGKIKDTIKQVTLR
jgi:hypothetical protein